jgi:aryl-alcohol dehydrogenase-like predicted oxidoreductase
MMGEDDRRRIIFGCGNFGGMGSSPSFRSHGEDRSTAFALLSAAREAGLTRFDTANTYGGGASELWLGDWLAEQDTGFRARAEVATKLGNPHGCPASDAPLSKTQVAFHIDQSLKRLRLERLSLLYLHEFDRLTPLVETLEALHAAIRAGKIERFGVSNAGSADILAVLAAAENEGEIQRFDHVQNEFSLLERGDLDTVIPLTRAKGLRYVAFSPLAGGLLTGKYRRGAEPPSGTRLAAAREVYASRLTPAAFDVIEALARDADAAGIAPAEAALRFVLDAPGVDALIIAPRDRRHLASYGLGTA